uniref:glutathione transferase n=1 Tax=Dianthus caryophyllus TaxID=3570 RepID=I4DUE3_DIACA|nr:glutathione S-transferase like protein [Dianthus caryophyllus]
MGVIKVYGAKKAACPQRVIACLIELGIDYDVIFVDLESGHHKQPDFLALQPFGQVPVIEDGDFRLYESRAIIRYLATKYSPKNSLNNNLLGTNVEEKAFVDQWLEVEAHHFNQQVYNIVLELIVFPKMGKQTDISYVHSLEKKLANVLDVYEERLSKSKYLAGDFFTLADLSHLPGLRYLTTEAKMPHLVEDLKCVNAWWTDISSRPAWKKVLSLDN